MSTSIHIETINKKRHEVKSTEGGDIIKREVYILAAVILLLTGCSSQRKESPSAQPEAELESESRSKAAVDIKPAADASANSVPDSEEEIPEWWGTYQDGDKQLGITNFDGTMFQFGLKAGEDHVLDGAAAVEPENHYTADYMDLHFERCPDCRAKAGGLHHFGCDIENCPVCHGQMLLY